MEKVLVCVATQVLVSGYRHYNKKADAAVIIKAKILLIGLFWAASDTSTFPFFLGFFDVIYLPPLAPLVALE